MGLLLLKNGRIVDGTGSAAFNGHVLIDGDQIKAVFKHGEALPEADMSMDAAGQVISPGFIDMHSHSDWVMMLKDHDIPLKCLLEQGVTTIVGGNCGFSPAPITDKTRRLISEENFDLMVDRPLDYQWDTMGDFLDRVAQTGPVLNTAHLVGHGSIRIAHADSQRGALTENEMTDCLNSLRQSLDQGACGLSFGLGYDPGMYSPESEIEAFCGVAAKAGKPVTVHIKALSRISPTYSPAYMKAHNVRALKEMIDVARKTGVTMQISHLVFVGRNSWSTAEKCLEMIEDAREYGIDIKFDAFPYTFGNTIVNAVMPYWFLAKLPDRYHSRWARAILRVELAIGFWLLGFSYKDFQLMDAVSDKWAALNGHRFLDIAKQWGMSPFNTVLKLSEASQGQALVLLHTYSGEPGNEKVLDAVLSNDLCLFQTDAITRYGGYPNPAALGTFPKILGEYVRKRRLFSMENAVNRMTAASAERFNIKDRGVIAPGKKADVVVFDPTTIDEVPAVGTQPAKKPKGITHVFINGTQVVKDGNYISGVRAGEVIRV